MSLADQVVLDWRPRHDERSLRYTIADHFGTDKSLRKRSWTRRQWLDQGREGACTGFGAAHVMGSTPRPWLTMNNSIAQALYREAQQRDEWPGEQYQGSSVLGAMQALRDRMWISAYYWARSVDELAHGVAQYGPMEIGVPWTEGMFEPDRSGLLHVTGRVVGGHALAVDAVDPDRQLFRLANSWGRDWGVNGWGYLRFNDMARLLAEDGEAALPRKVKA